MADTPDNVLSTDIAIVGMSCRVPGARDADAFWRNLRDGVESIRALSEEELREAGVPPALLADPRYVRRGAPLEDMECFDAAFFGMSPHEAAIMDPQHRHFLETAWEALEHAGHVPARFGKPIGVFAGSGHNAYLSYNLLTRPELLETDGFFLLRHTGNDKDFLTTRVSYVFDLQGPSVAVQTACSTSLVAVHMAVQSLLAGECDMAIAGGVTVELPHRHGYLYAEGEILSPDGHCRAFDAKAEGTVFGSGAGAVVLRRLSDAIADGDCIYAIVKGTAVNNDGSKKVSYLAPSVEGQADAVTEALAVSGVDASSIGFIAAHGTGTPVGDPIEVAALTEAFRHQTDRRGYCAIGSVKTNIGHLDTAAGVASLIAAVQALRHRQLPPSLHFESPNPACRFEETPFFVNAALREWTSTGPRRAGVSSLGVGGTNAHVIVEEAPAAGERPDRSEGPGTRHLLVLSAKTPAALERATDRLSVALEDAERPRLADAAWTLQVGREAMRHRRVVVACEGEDAARALRARDPQRVFSGEAPERTRTVAFMFAGGGAQHPAMGSGLYREEPVYRDAVDQCLAALEPAHAADVRQLLLGNGDESAARSMERPTLGLPALFITQYAQAKLWAARGVEPSALIGHSMGEYTAAALAGVFSVKDALALVTKRARLFETVEEGAMLSVPLPAAELLGHLESSVSIAAVNAPALAVASGPVEAIERLRRTLADAGIDSSRLRINVAAHSSLLEPILGEFRSFVRGLALAPPKIPIASNLSGTWLTDAEATDAEYWVRHLRQTVRFADGVRTLVGDGSRVLLEVGPGRVLSSLARQQGGTPVVAIPSMRHPDEAFADGEVMLTALGRLWAAGVEVDWTRLHDGPRRRVALPTYPFERERHWIDARPATGGASTSTTLHRTADIGDWFAQPSWRRASPVPALTFDGPVLIFADRSPMAKALLERVRSAGLEVFTARRGTRFQQVGPDTYSITPGSTDDAARLLATLRDAGRLPRRIVFAWPLEDPSLDTGFFALLALVQALGAEEVNCDLMVLTAGAVRISDESNLEPRLGTLVGAVPVIPAELPGVHARLVDVGRDRSPSPWFVEHLAAELAATGPDIVALRGPDRWVPTVEPLHLDAPVKPAFRERGTYLVTGAFGGLGLAVARHLAAAYQARLVMVGRHALPPAADWDGWLASHDADDETSRRIHLVRELESLGAEVLAVSADVTDAAALRRGIEEARRRFGALHGVLHAAGVLDDGALQVREAAASRKVLAPKVHGTLALHEALRGSSPDFVVLFSSISAFAGLPGQFDYAAANAFLDAWAQARADEGGTRVVTINWAPWSDVGMAAALAGAIGVGAPRNGEPTGHPVLARRVALSAREQAFTGVISPDHDWMLAEHRVRGGEPLLPGTGSLALVHTAERLAGREGPLALREVEFVDALIVPEGSRCEIRVRLDSAEGRFALESRRDPSTPWRLHVRGRTGVPSGLAAPVDLMALRARCTQSADPAAVTSEAPHLAFGPRWNNVTAIHVGQREALIELQLDPRFAADLGPFPLHPALLDLGLAGAQALVPWLDRREQLLVPLSIGTLKVYAALDSRVASRVRYREDLSTPGDVAVFDVALCDLAGRVLVEAGEFHMLAMRDRTRLAAPPAKPTRERNAAPPANPLLTLTLREGIRSDEGIAALERVMAAGALPQVAVSPLPLEPLLAQLRTGTRAAPVVTAAFRPRAAESPRGETMTPLQQEIASFVGSVLAMPEIGLDENVIDLGLHSLLAVRLFNRLKKLTGLNLPLSTLLEAPTVRTLSQRFGDQGELPAASARVATPLPGPMDIVSSSDAVRDPRAHEHWLRPLWSHVVPLKPQGSLPPFFVIHARGGAVLNYRTLSTFVDPEQPVYGIQCRGLDGRTEPFRSLEEMAAQYVEEIRRIQPHGPYFLGGGSLGGIVALEMAQQLRADGERVGLLAMFDSWGPIWFSPEHMPSAPARFSRRISGHVQRLKREGVTEELRLLRRRGWGRLEGNVKKVACRVLRALGAELPHNLRYFYVEQANLAALRRYVPQEYPADVTLFRALDDPDADFSDPTMGWRATVQGEIEVIDCPGTHNSLVHDPVFGELFRARLRQAQHDAAGATAEPFLATAGR